MKPLKDTQKAIVDTLKQHNVVLGYVFGSYAKGNMTPLSDVDIAIVFDTTVPKSDYFNKQLAIAHELGQLLKIDRVDVVNLITAPSPLLKQQAALKGICILDEDHALRQKLELQILQEYEDTQYLRAVQSRILHEQIRQGTFGKPIISPYESN